MEQFTVTSRTIDDMIAAIKCVPGYEGWSSFGHEHYQEDEVTWKREAAREIQGLLAPAEVPTSFDSPDQSDAFIGALETAVRKTNILNAPTGNTGVATLKNLQPDQRRPFCVAMRELLHGSDPSPERLEGFLAATQGFSIQNPWAFITYFLFFTSPDTEMLVRPEATTSLLAELGASGVWSGKPTADSYSGILQVARSLLPALAPHGAKDMIDVQSFIWVFSRRPRVWKLATGKPPLDMWSVWESDGMITIGWDELGDVGKMSKPQFDQRCAELLAAHPQEEGWAKSALRQVWKFAHHIKPGHWVVANRGQQHVLAIGRVTGEYTYTPSVTHGHRRAVEWADRGHREVSEAGWLNTLLELEWRKLQQIRRAPIADPPPRRSWVFQANPKRYDLVGALSKLPRIPWSVRQRTDEVHDGDEVFLWQSGPHAALVATARVDGTPAPMGEDPAEAEFIRDPALADGDVPRVWLHINTVLEVPLTREHLMAESAVGQIPVFEGWQGTNYLLTADEADAIRNMIAKHRHTPKPPSFASLVAGLHEQRLYFPPEAVANYLLALQTKRFVILSGISGTGKTKLAQAVAKHFAGAGGDHVVPVRPDWTDNRGLLGYYNPLRERYETTPFLDLLLAAAGEWELARKAGRQPRPFFAILDEMNLARVEHYFSDFLSCLESEKPIPLRDQGQPVEASRPGVAPVPADLEIPRNLFFTGTVNVDETTYMFSPKVVDRAFTIELNEVRLDCLDGTDMGEACCLALGEWKGDLAFRGNPDAEDWKKMGMAERETLLALHALLEKHNRHFGYRVACEIARFVVLAEKQAGPKAVADALDLAILQKVLPKFHGTRAELQEVLAGLFSFAVAGESGKEHPWGEWEVTGAGIARVGSPKAAQTTEDPEAPDEGQGGAGDSSSDTALANETAHQPKVGATMTPCYPRTARKVWRMLDRLQKQGFTAYME